MATRVSTKSWPYHFFYIGLRRDCPELIDAIEALDTLDERLRFMKMLAKGNFLLAAYLTPYSTITKAVSSAFRDAAELVNDVEAGKIPPLANLTKMQLLCLITHMLCDSYGYDYFQPALEERSLDLYSSPDLESKHLLELFLTNAVLVSNGKEKSFDTMIENYGSKIPLELQMAIFEHASERKAESKVVKKFMTNTFKRTKSNISLSRSIEALYERPLKSESSASLQDDRKSQKK